MKKKEKGQSMVEYVALTALVAIVCIGTVKVFGGKVKSRLNQVTTTFDRNVQQGLKSRSHDSDDEEDDVKVPGGIHLPKLPRLPFPLPR